MNGNDTFLDVNDAHLRVTSGNVYASAFNLDQIDIVMSSNTASTVNFNNPTKAFNAASNIEVGTANLFVDTTTSNVGIGTDTPLDTLHINGGTRFAGHIIPTTNATFDIGSAENKVRDLYVDTNSIWVGDRAKIAFENGKMKFKRRKLNKVPRMLVNLAISGGRTDEADVETHAVAFAQTKDSSISSVSDLKLEHLRDYAKTFDETKSVSDIFADNEEDYEAITASEAFMEVGSNIFTEHSLSIGKTTDPTVALDVEGTVKATTFEGDGSALTGIVAGQWTESGGNISRSTGNVSVGEQTSEQIVTQNYNSLTNIPASSRASGTWRSHTFGNITLPANWSNDNFQFKVTVNGTLDGVPTAEYISIIMKKQGSGTQPSVSLNFNPQNQSSGITSGGGNVYYTNVVNTNSTVSNGSFSAGDVVDIYMTIYVTYWSSLSLAVEIRGGGTTSILFVDGTNDRVGIGLTQPTTALDVSGTVKATAFEGDGSALTGISSGQWTYTAGTNSGTQQLVFDDQAPGTTFTGTLSGNVNNTAIRDTTNRYIRVTQGGTSRIGSVYWQTTLTNNWEATFEIYILPINYGGADDMRFIFYATNPITSNDGATGTNGHGGAYMRWEYYNSDHVELYDHTATRVWQQSATLQMSGWMPVTVTFNNGQLTSTIKNSSGTTLKTTTYDFGTTYSARYNTPTYVAVTGRSGGVQAEDRVRNITINALNVPTGHKLTRMNANVGIDVANPTQKLDVSGTVKATAFEGDGSALTGITSGQWTESSGDIYRSSGNVGVGTTNPESILHVQHTTTNNAFIKALRHNETSSTKPIFAVSEYQMTGETSPGTIIGNHNRSIHIGPVFEAGNAVGSTDIRGIHIKSTGDVGIGTTSPEEKLHVQGQIRMTSQRAIGGTYNSYLDWPNSGHHIDCYKDGSAHNFHINHYAQQTVYLNRSGYSDRRIKEDVKDIDDVSALDTLRKIKPKTYKYKLQPEKGTVYGFIAQDVREVLPYATNLTTLSAPFDREKFVNATILEDGMVNLDGPCNELEIGKNAYFYYESSTSTRDFEVTEIISPTQFRVRVDDSVNEWIGDTMLVGKEVNDFHGIDKDAIFTVTTAALQEVDRQLQDTKAQLATVLARLDALESA